MKNITEILTGLGIQIPEDKKTDFDKEFAENYKTVADYNKQKLKLDQAQNDLSTARTQLESFKDVDVNDLKNQITTLTNTLATKETEHAAELADRDFTAMLDAAIAGKHGRSAKAIKAMLDVDSLKASKNQEQDVSAALDQLAKDSGYLFDSETPPPYAGGTGTKQPAAGQNAALRAAFGLQAENNK